MVIASSSNDSDPSVSRTGPAKVLVAEDDDQVRDLLTVVLRRGGYEVIHAVDGLEAISKMRPDVSVVILDNAMPHRSGIECLPIFREKFPGTVVLMLSVGGVDNAVAAMREGAFWYLQKPVEPTELLALVEKACEVSLLRDRTMELQEAASEPHMTFIGDEAFLMPSDLASRIDKVASLDCTVLITGETGTGKSTLARMLHQKSARSRGPFAAISCAALPRDLLEAELFGHERGAFTGAIKSRPGRLELADNGTLFLDEIGDMPLDIQPKLLTFLESRVVERLGGTTSKKISIRIISATLQDLNSMCEERRFREDLFFRLNVFGIHLAPLRERMNELPSIVRTLTHRIATRYGIDAVDVDASALDKLAGYGWPGNLRELEHCLERALLLSTNQRSIAPEFIEFDRATKRPPASPEDFPLGGMPLAVIERLAINKTLELCGGNKREAARRLGISEKSIYNKMQRFQE